MKSLTAAMNSLREAALKEETADTITGEQVANALKVFMSITGKDTYLLHPKDWAQLPSGAHDDLASVLNDVEENMMWPVQDSLNRMCFITKQGR